MTIDLHDEYSHLDAAYNAFEDLLHAADSALFDVRPGVSGWSPAQHLFHILKSNGMMLKGIRLICKGAPPVLPEGALNRMGRIILERGRFLRGGQAPDAVVPPKELTLDDLRQAFARSRATYDATAALLPEMADAQGYLPHMFLGDLDARQWLRLARLHSEHHLGIVRDILAHYRPS